MNPCKHIKISLIAIIAVFSVNIQALTVSPARIEIMGDPGQTLVGEINVYNEQGEDKNFYTSYENFQSSDDSGAPKFVGSDTGLATWIKTDLSIAVKSQEKKVIPFTITIPADAEPGGYFSAIFLGNQAPSSAEDGNVSIGGKIGILVLLRVNGDIREGAGLTNFSTENSKRFYTNLPIGFTYKISNTGSDRIVPVGNIKIKNTIRLNSATFNINEGRGSVLPSSVRKFETMWGDKDSKPEGFFNTALYQLKNFHIGFYTAVINLSWGESVNNATKETFTFFVLPWQLLLLFILLIVFVGFFGIISLRKYNKWIIKKARLALLKE